MVVIEKQDRSILAHHKQLIGDTKMTREIEAKGKSRYQRLLNMKWSAKGSVISIYDEDCARPQDVMLCSMHSAIGLYSTRTHCANLMAEAPRMRRLLEWTFNTLEANGVDEHQTDLIEVMNAINDVLVHTSGD